MRIFSVVAILIFAIAAPISAAWVNNLDTNGTSEVMVLTGNAVFDGSLWDYTYDLANPAINTDIVRAFTLTFPNQVIVSEFTNYLPSPTSWIRDVFDKKVIWTWLPQYNSAGGIINLNDRLDPGDIFQFGFSSPRKPGGPALASAQNDFAFDGPTRGPAIPEATTVMLGLTGFGAVLGLISLKRK